MRLIVLSVLLLVVGIGGTHAAPRPGLVPPGWTEESVDRGRRYVSPDGSAWFTLYASPAEGRSIDAFLDNMTAGEGERVTYHRRTGRWMAVSGFRGDRIFYRKTNLACGGTRWHTIWLEYPAADKRRMDPVVTHIAHAMNRYGDDCPRRGRS